MQTRQQFGQVLSQVSIFDMKQLHHCEPLSVKTAHKAYPPIVQEDVKYIITEEQLLNWNNVQVVQKEFCSFASNHSVIYFEVSFEQDGANICIYLPKIYSGVAVIHCHGYRPHSCIYWKSTDLKISTTESYQHYLEQGMIVAMTSYRRAGPLMRDAILDIENVRLFIEAHLGRPRYCFLEGRSMGGGIATRISEYYSENYDGILAIGAALYVDQRNETQPLLLQYKPKLPILFLTNISETGPIEQYIEKVRAVQQQQERYGMQEEIYLPALWTIGREGHNWVNEQERISAMRYLFLWVQFQTFITVRHKENTYLSKQRPNIHPQPTQLKNIDSKESAYACTVVDCNEVAGTFTLNLVEADLKKLGIQYRKPFYLKIGEEVLEVRLAVFPFLDVPHNSYIAIIEPNYQYTVISQNTFEYKNLLIRYGIKVGMSLLLFC